MDHHESLSDGPLSGIYESLRDAAQHGSIHVLYELIEKDAKVLDRMNDIPFVDTPLHIAAFAGHTQFAMEVMNLKPSFARKLNPHGFTPMHLALQKFHALENDYVLQKKQTKLVNRLLDVVGKDLVRIPGREGVTTLHYVTQKGNLDFLEIFLRVCPESLEDLTIREENVLHIALKSNMLDAFWYLVRWLRRAFFKDAKLLQDKLLHSEDEEDNTLLHIAVSKNQPEVVKWLLNRESFVSRLLNIGSIHKKNLEGNTVFDILERQTQTQVDNQRIRNMLRRRCVKRLTARPEHCLRSCFKILLKFYVGLRRRQTVITEERRNALLVVAALLITVTYQAALSPDQQPNEFNCTVPSPTNVNASAAINKYDQFNCTARFNPNGEVNTSRDRYVGLFYGINTAVFYLTNVTLFFLVPPDFIGWLLTVLVGLLFLSYCLSTPLLSNARIIAWFGFFGGYFVFLPLLLWFRMAMASFKSASSNYKGRSVPHDANPPNT